MDEAKSGDIMQEAENSNRRKITKIKYKGTTGRVEIEYFVKRPEIGPLALDEFKFACNDKPLPEFVDTLKRLAYHVIQMCELSILDTPLIEVTGVSFSYSGPEKTMGATIIAQKKLKLGAKLNLVTPHKPADFYGGDGDSDQLLDERCVADLKDLLKHAQRYIDGDRAQLVLFPSDEKQAQQEAATDDNQQASIFSSDGEKVSTGVNLKPESPSIPVVKSEELPSDQQDDVVKSEELPSDQQDDVVKSEELPSDQQDDVEPLKINTGNIPPPVEKPARRPRKKETQPQGAGAVI
jgi:hypothetical protein